jgi:hypothetical protein
MAGTKSFWDRVKPLLRMFQYNKSVSQPTKRPPMPSAQPVVPQPVQNLTGPMDMGQKVATIAEAGRRRVLLEMTYNGVTRKVEPYSFRSKSNGRLFYGFCYKDQGIESFSLEKIEKIIVTEEPFSPRWEVEF